MTQPIAEPTTVPHVVPDRPSWTCLDHDTPKPWPVAARKSWEWWREVSAKGNGGGGRTARDKEW